MPYGMPKSMGGDTPALDAKMERCVQHVMDQGHSKDSAIAICKASLEGTTSRAKPKVPNRR